jgi:hypothetical protein
MTHYLKTWPRYFQRIKDNEKTFEVRVNDRDYQTNDLLVLQEYDPEVALFTGQELNREISYILHGGQFGIEKGYVVMGLYNRL